MTGWAAQKEGAEGRDVDWEGKASAGGGAKARGQRGVSAGEGVLEEIGR